MPREMKPAGAWHGMRAAAACVWNCIWFQNTPTTPLEVARIGLGAAILLHYILATPFLYLFWGDNGWMPRADRARIQPRSRARSETGET